MELLTLYPSNIRHLFHQTREGGIKDSNSGPGTNVNFHEVGREVTYPLPQSDQWENRGIPWPCLGGYSMPASRVEGSSHSVAASIGMEWRSKRESHWLWPRLRLLKWKNAILIDSIHCAISGSHENHSKHTLRWLHMKGVWFLSQRNGRNIGCGVMSPKT